MRTRKWAAKTNALMVIAGLKGKSVAEIGPAHQSSHSQDDQWRDQLRTHAAKACAGPQPTRQEARREPEQTRVQKLVGELPLE